ncbi:MAG: glucokinase [Nitrospinales bacterium]
MILAGDIGGTSVKLGLFQNDSGQLSLKREFSFKSKDFSGIEPILLEFLEKEPISIDQACFGVAGPVEKGRSELTNLQWKVEVEALKKSLGTENVWLINDLAAMACSIPFLKESEIEVLQEGEADTSGRTAVIAAGTGLGQAFLIPESSDRYLVIDSEGGHCDFPFNDGIERDLFHFLQCQFGRVSIERVLSGSGLSQIYHFLNKHLSIDEPEWLSHELMNNDPASVITINGINEKSETCKKALELFITFYGRVAGNLALQFRAKGGVYIGGGIAPKIISQIKSGKFLESFLSKGRFQNFMGTIPVKVIMNEKASLLGAAQYALGKSFTR